jgi:hypothetical protein
MAADTSTRASAIYDERPALSEQEWLSVLKLSTQWLFNDLRQEAISHLSSAEGDPIDRICLAKEFRVYHWLLEGYERVVERLASPQAAKGPFTVHEGKVVGLEVALELSGIVIKRLRGNNGGSVKGDLLAVFKDEFDCIRQDEARFLTRADQAKEQATTKLTSKEAKPKKKAKRAEQKSIQEEPLGKESEAEEANAKPLERAVLEDVVKDVQGGSDGIVPMNDFDFDREEITKLKAEIMKKKKQEQEKLRWDEWGKEQDRKKEQKLNDLAVKVLRDEIGS